jgi:hypothetical protein
VICALPSTPDDQQLLILAAFDPPDGGPPSVGSVAPRAAQVDAGPAPVTGHVVLGAVQWGGQAPRDADSVLARATALTRACYNKELKTRPATRGRLVMTLRIEPSGDVTGASPSLVSSVSQELVACVTGRLRNLTFAPTGNMTVVQVPLTFESGPGP